MGKIDARVDAYLNSIPAYAKPVLEHLRVLIHEVCPDVEETWKWSFPNFSYKGNVLCSMAAFKEHCAFNFWKAALMADDDKILTVTERNSMGHLGKITRLEDLPADEVMRKYLQLAMTLNEQGAKVPRKKPTPEEKKELVVPACLLDGLAENPEALASFERFPYSHKKEYADWINGAKTAPTREKRVAQAIEWIAAGKGRNWKYEKK